jgi:hypothetical protein
MGLRGVSPPKSPCPFRPDWGNDFDDSLHKEEKPQGASRLLGEKRSPAGLHTVASGAPLW